MEADSGQFAAAVLSRLHERKAELRATRIALSGQAERHQRQLRDLTNRTEIADGSTSAQIQTLQNFIHEIFAQRDEENARRDERFQELDSFYREAPEQRERGCPVLKARNEELQALISNIVRQNDRDSARAEAQSRQHARLVKDLLHKAISSNVDATRAGSREDANQDDETLVAELTRTIDDKDQEIQRLLQIVQQNGQQSSHFTNVRQDPAAELIEALQDRARLFAHTIDTRDQQIRDLEERLRRCMQHNNELAYAEGDRPSDQIERLQARINILKNTIEQRDMEIRNLRTSQQPSGQENFYDADFRAAIQISEL